MSISNSQREQLSAAAAIMFEVPVGGYSGMLEGMLAAHGGDVLGVMNDLAAVPYFQTLYTGNHNQAASKLAGAYGFTAQTGGLGQWVHDFFLCQLDAGATIQSLVQLANDFLLNTNSPAYAEAKGLLQNKIAVGNFYTYGVDGSSQDIAALHHMFDGLTSELATAAAAKSALAAAMTDGSGLGSVSWLTTGADVSTGTAGNDNVDGLAGDDTISGGAGNDHLVGGIGTDVLYGGDGSDVVIGGSGDDTLNAANLVSYTIGLVNGQRGTTSTTYDAHGDVLLGGDGSDTLYGSPGSDVLDGGLGADSIYADRLSYSNATEADFMSGLTSDQQKALFNDVIFGGEGNDTIYGGYGTDTIDAGAGNDMVFMPSGGGYVNAGDGDDTVSGSKSNDMIYGGAGKDALDGGSGGIDFIDAGADDDTITSSREGGHLAIIAGSGDDFVNLRAGHVAANVLAGEGVDRIWLGDGVYDVDLTENVSAKDTLNVGTMNFEGRDISLYSRITGFNPLGDVIDLPRFDLWGSTSYYGWSDAGYGVNYTGAVIRTNAQTISSPTTAFESPVGNGDYSGKGIFIITGASAAAADVQTAANFLDPYGNNATYGFQDTHFFVVDVAGQGAMLYRFHDDTNADARITPDELMPLVMLNGVHAADLTYLNFV